MQDEEQQGIRADLRWREVHRVAEERVGGIAVALNGVEQREVVAVDGDCRH